MWTRMFAVPAGIAVVTMTGCASLGGGGGDEQPIAREWTAGAAEHLALWFHGLATARQAAEAAGIVLAPEVLPSYRPGYAIEMTQAKRDAGVYPTVLDRRAEEFGRAFASDDAFDALQFLPLYFIDTAALFTALQTWAASGGDLGRVGPQGRGVIEFLNALFPQTAQRRTVGEWAAVLEEEARVFYRPYWERRFLDVERTAVRVERDWRGLADTLSAYLDYVDLEGGDIFLVPALGAEGRLVSRGAGVPRVAVMAPDTARPDESVLALVHEIMYPLVADVVRDHVSPARLRELGERPLSARAAVRAGAMLLDQRAPARVEPYQRFYLAHSNREVAASGVAEAFEQAFALPDDLVAPLRTAIERAQGGI